MVRQRVGIVEHPHRMDDDLADQAFFDEQLEGVVNRRLGSFHAFAIDARQYLVRGKMLRACQQHARDLDPLAGRRDAAGLQPLREPVPLSICRVHAGIILLNGGRVSRRCAPTSTVRKHPCRQGCRRHSVTHRQARPRREREPVVRKALPPMPEYAPASGRRAAAPRPAPSSGRSGNARSSATGPRASDARR